MIQARNALKSAVLALALAVLTVAWAGAREIRLKDGTVLQGEIQGREDSLVIIRGESFGEVKVKSSQLVTEGEGETGAGAEKTFPREPQARAGAGEPSDQALFFLPTAFTPPKSSFVFRDFELLFLTFGYSPTASTSITAGFLFPITTEVQLLTAGFKQRLWMDGSGSSAVAVTGNFTKPVGDFLKDDIVFLSGNLVAGRRAEFQPGMEAGLHATVGYLGVTGEDSEGNVSFGFGTELSVTPHVKLMGEYLSVAPFDTDNDFAGGMLTLGFRLHGARLAADIAGLRPINAEDMGDLIFWPLLVVSYRI